jgi:hypothetical protein
MKIYQQVCRKTLASMAWQDYETGRKKENPRGKHTNKSSERYIAKVECRQLCIYKKLLKRAQPYTSGMWLVTCTLGVFTLLLGQRSPKGWIL